MSDSIQNSLGTSFSQKQQYQSSPTSPVPAPAPPTPASTKSMQRSKTVRNLGSAGNKVRGLFKKQQIKDTAPPPPPSTEDTTRYSTNASSRPIMTTSASYASPLTEDRFIDRPLSYPDTHLMEKSFSSGDNRYSHLHTSSDIPHRSNTIMATQQQNTAPRDLPSTITSPTQTMNIVDDNDKDQQDMPPEAEELKRQLDQLSLSIGKVRQEVSTQVERKQQLQTDLDEARRVYQERETEYSNIEHNFFQLTRAVRATDDDLSTIRDSLKLLKYNVSRVVMTLNKKANKDQAKAKFIATWPHLSLVDSQGELVEPSHINFLAEKLIHEHLVLSVFRCPVYPGLEINDSYAALSQWFAEYGSNFSVRLRQQLALILAKSSKMADSDLATAIQAEKDRIVDLIYNDLAAIYDPFIGEHDKQVPIEKSYRAKVADILDKAFKLAVAIRGQEVEITTLDLEEGKQEIDVETMVEVRGKTSGIIRFCICPAFVGGDGEHGFLEKGKVVVV